MTVFIALDKDYSPVLMKNLLTIIKQLHFPVPIYLLSHSKYDYKLKAAWKLKGVVSYPLTKQTITDLNS